MGLDNERRESIVTTFPTTSADSAQVPSDAPLIHSRSRLLSAINAVAEKKVEQDLESEKRKDGLLAFNKGELLNDDLVASYLHIYSKNEPVDTEGYTIQLYGEGQRFWAKGLYRVTPYAFVLLKDENPIACIGVDVESETMLKVKQLQAVPEQREAHSVLRWEKMFLKVIEDWGQRHGFNEAGVTKAEDTDWWNKKIPDLDRHRQALKMRFDITAKRSGYKFDKKRNCFVKKLGDSEEKR